LAKFIIVELCMNISRRISINATHLQYQIIGSIFAPNATLFAVFSFVRYGANQRP